MRYEISEMLLTIVGALIGAILGFATTYGFTKWGIKESLKIQLEEQRKENLERWERWSKQRRSLATGSSELSANIDLIYEIRDWAYGVQTSLNQGGTPASLAHDLQNAINRMHLSSVASLLVLGEFPRELEKYIVDLYIQAEYIYEEVQNYCSAFFSQTNPQLLSSSVQLLGWEASAVLKKANELKPKMS